MEKKNKKESPQSRWNKKNKEKVQKSRLKSACKRYILNVVNSEELEEVKEWISEKESKKNQENT